MKMMGEGIALQEKDMPLKVQQIISGISRKEHVIGRGERIAVLVAGETLILFLSVVLASWLCSIYQGLVWHFEFPCPQIFLLVLPWLFIALISDAYSSKNAGDLLRSIKQPMRTGILAWLVYITLYFFAPRAIMPRMVVLFFGVVSCFLLTLWRWAHFIICSNYRWCERVLIAGNAESQEAVRKLVKFEKPYYQLIDCGQPCPDNNEDIDCSSCPLQTRNPAAVSMDAIVFAIHGNLPRNCLQSLTKFRESGVSIIPMPLFYEQLTRRIQIEHLEGWYMSFLPLTEAERGTIYPLLKRILDLCCAVAGLLVSLLLVPLLALAIKLDSPGPLFFSQVRVGKNGKRFKLWKLRTMVVDAENQGEMWTQKGDPRVTRTGLILRRLHLDEFPQVWNLLKGDVSVVGVRPLTVKQCEKFAQEIPFHNFRHLVKPGLTSWAVVNYRHVNDIEGARIRLEYDLYYVKYQSLWLDMYIIFRTIWTMITMNGL